MGKNGQISEKSDTSWEKNGENSEKSDTIWEKNGENSEKKFITLFVQKIQSEKTFDGPFGLNRTLQKPRKTNEIMNPIFGLGHEIQELKYKIS